MVQRRRRRSSSSRRSSSGRTGRAKAGPGPRLAAAALLGAAGLGFMLKGRGGDEPTTPPPALMAAAAPGGILPAPLPPAPAEADHESAGAVPPALLGAFARLGEASPDALVDLRSIVTEYPGTPEAERAREALEREAARWLAQGRELAGTAARAEEALRALTLGYLATVPSQERRALRAEVQPLVDAVLLGADAKAGPALLGSYAVQPGDSLSRIAKEHGTDYRLIMAFNRLKKDRIRVGQRLRVPKGDVSLVVLKRDFELVILFGGLLLRSFDVATGKDDKTPQGTFTIGTKQVEPDWYSPEGKVYKYGTPENVLGTRWLAFVNTPEHQGFGIHGTKFPESIGTEASMGCIRLRNEDVEVVFELVPPGSTVRILR